MTWAKQTIEWTEHDQAFLSIVFTWDLPQAYQRAVWLRQLGYHVIAGGPAVDLMPHYLEDVAQINGQQVDALPRHNPLATFTSRGCIRQCPFCAVWRTEGKLRELDHWPIRPIVCDNNLLACSRAHFDRVVDTLKPLSGIDFNQGLDARLLTPYHADRLAELDCLVRLAFDNISYEPQFMHAFETLRAAGFPKKRLRTYVLIGFDDTPEDALYRLQTVADLGIRPNPMRYQPLDSMNKNSYVGEHWTAKELNRYMHYWSRLRWYDQIPFETFTRTAHRRPLTADASRAALGRSPLFAPKEAHP